MTMWLFFLSMILQSPAAPEPVKAFAISVLPDSFWTSLGPNLVALGGLCTSIIVLIVQLRNAKVTKEIHTSTNSNFSEQAKKLDVANDTIQSLHNLIIERSNVSADAARVATTEALASTADAAKIGVV